MKKPASLINPLMKMSPCQAIETSYHIPLPCLNTASLKKAPLNTRTQINPDTYQFLVSSLSRLAAFLPHSLLFPKTNSAQAGGD